MDHLGKSLRELSDHLSADQRPASCICFGTVASVTAGASADGVAQIAVTVDGGATLPTPYPDTYTSPAVGHRVVVGFSNGSPAVIAHLVGFPNLTGGSS